MSLRFSITDALARGFIDKATATSMQAASKAHTREPAAKAAPASESPLAPAAERLAHLSANAKPVPQRLLFDALERALPGLPEWEKERLIPGRNYRADIFIPPNITVEMDGFAFHRSKDAFQSDRDRQNLFARYGYRVFRAYTKQCLDEAMLAELVDLIVQAYAEAMPAARG